MPEAGDAVEHHHAGLGGGIERLDGLHDRRRRQSAAKMARTKSMPAIEAMTSVGVTPYSISGGGVVHRPVS